MEPYHILQLYNLEVPLLGQSSQLRDERRTFEATGLLLRELTGWASCKRVCVNLCARSKDVLTTEHTAALLRAARQGLGGT